MRDITIFDPILKKIKKKVFRPAISWLMFSGKYDLPDICHILLCIFTYYAFTYKAKLYNIAQIGDWFRLHHGCTSKINSVFLYFSQEKKAFLDPNPYFLTQWYYSEYLNNVYTKSALCHYLLIGSISGNSYSPLCKIDKAEFISAIPYDIVNKFLSPDRKNPYPGKIFREISTTVENVWEHDNDYIVNIRLQCKNCIDWCLSHGKEVIEFGSGEVTVLPEPEFALGCDIPTVFKNEEQGLPFYIAHPGKVMAVSGTTLMFMEDGTHCCDMLEYTLGTKDKVMLSPLSVWGQQPKTVRLSAAPDVIPKGLIGFYNVDANYYHWIIEGLTRIFAARQTGRYDEYPILITKQAYASLRRSIEILYPKAKIIEIPQMLNVIVEEAVYPSEMNIIYEPVPYTLCTPDHIRVNIPVLKEMRSQFLRNHTKSHAIPDREKIYVDRPSDRGRQITNAEQFMPLIRSHGFETVYPEQYSLDEQIEIFRHAKQIIIPTGAAVTNIMFCENAEICTLQPAWSIGIINIWRSLAALGNNKFGFISGKSKEMYSEYTVNVDDIAQCLDYLS